MLFMPLLLTLFCQKLSAAEINASLEDSYLETQYDWAMFIETRAVTHYLNYTGSKLRPLTKAIVYLRIFPHSPDSKQGKSPSKVYEEFWYHKGSIIGMRRRNRLNIEQGRNGIIIVGKGLEGQDMPAAAANALLRVSLDMQFQRILESVVQVPLEHYDQVVAGLANYHLSHREEPQEGKQFSIHLRSFPEGREDYYYMR